MSNYPLRLPETIMSKARKMAEAEGVSINQFLSTLIAERIGELNALNTIRSRIARADKAKALTILSKIPSGKPVPGDEFARTSPKRRTKAK